MSYLIDSDWVIDVLKGKSAAYELFRNLTQDVITISLMTYGEVYEGIYYGTNRRVHLLRYESPRASITVRIAACMRLAFSNFCAASLYCP